MKTIILIISMIFLYCNDLECQETYSNARVVTWDQIDSTDYQIIYENDDDITVITINGELVIIKCEK